MYKISLFVFIIIILQLIQISPIPAVETNVLNADFTPTDENKVKVREILQDSKSEINGGNKTRGEIYKTKVSYKEHFYNISKKYLDMNYNDEQWSRKHRQRVLNWQYYSSIAIFISVIIIIAMGLYMSFIQFRIDSDDADKKPKDLRIEDNIEKIQKKRPSNTSIKISRDGIEISSPVIGLLILFLSLCFFYFYLIKVYPIKEITSSNLVPTSQNYKNDLKKPE